VARVGPMSPLLLWAVACGESSGPPAPPWHAPDAPMVVPTTPSPTGTTATAGPVSPRVALQVGGLWDVDGWRGPTTVVMEGNTIVALLDGASIVPGAETWVLPGGFLVPGLIDPHVHLWLHGVVYPAGDAVLANLRSMLYWGVTTVVDVGGPLASVALRDRVRDGAIRGPDVLALGPFVTVDEGHPCEVMDDPDTCWYAADATAAAFLGDALRVAGTDGVKVALADASFTPWPSPSLSESAAQAAFLAHGGLSVAHIAEPEEAAAAIAAGAVHLAHPPFGAAWSADELAAVVASGVVVHSTVGAFSGADAVLAGTLLPTDRGPLLPQAVETWDALAGRPDAFDPQWIVGSAAWTATATANLSALRAAGGVVLPASDAGYWYVPPGWGLHRELAVLVALGESPEEVLIAATATAADALGLADRGRIAVGQRADLLVLAGDPRTDLSLLSAPTQVVLAGEVLLRDQIPSLDLLQRATSGALGDFCLDERDCATSACDLLSHRCADPCPQAGALRSDCGVEAFCAASDGDLGAPVCRPVDDPCALLDPQSTCSPSAYGETCYPMDLDTAGCGVAGPREAGEACIAGDPVAGCVPGAYCSPIDDRCYTFCDPASPRCGPGASCVEQAVGGSVWFALCLPP